MSETVKIDGKRYELVDTNEAGTLMTVKEDGWFKKEIKVPVSKIDSVEKDGNGGVALLAGAAVFAVTGFWL